MLMYNILIVLYKRYVELKSRGNVTFDPKTKTVTINGEISLKELHAKVQKYLEHNPGDRCWTPKITLGEEVQLIDVVIKGEQN